MKRSVIKFPIEVLQRYCKQTNGSPCSFSDGVKCEIFRKELDYDVEFNRNHRLPECKAKFPAKEKV